MNTYDLADLAIKEIKKKDIFSSAVYGSDEIKEIISEFNRIYEQANSKAFLLNVPSMPGFKLIERVIKKLIRILNNRQTEFNYKIMELIKTQQMIILKSLELFDKLKSTNDS